MATHSSVLTWRIPWTESTPSPAFIICRLFDDSLSDRCEMIPHCGLCFFNNEKIIFIFGCFYLLFHCCVRFSLVAASGGCSLLQYRSLLRWLFLLSITASRCIGLQ